MVRFPGCLAAALLMAGGCIAIAAGTETAVVAEKSGAKELYLPQEIWKVPKGNDFKDDASEFSFKRMVQSPDIAIFWSSEFGEDPMANPDPKKRFDVKEALKECDRFYDYYVNQMTLVQKGKSLTDRYKILFFVIGGDEGTACGGGADDKIAAMEAAGIRVAASPSELGTTLSALLKG